MKSMKGITVGLLLFAVMACNQARPVPNSSTCKLDHGQATVTGCEWNQEVLRVSYGLEFVDGRGDWIVPNIGYANVIFFDPNQEIITTKAMAFGFDPAFVNGDRDWFITKLDVSPPNNTRFLSVRLAKDKARTNPFPVPTKEASANQ